MGAPVRFVSAIVIALVVATTARAAEPAGPWYFVPVHEIELQATRTTTRSATFHRIDADSVPSGEEWEGLRGLLERFGPCVAFSPETSTRVEGSFSLVPMADTAVGRVPLSTAASAWADFDGSVQLTPQGFLAGVNVSAEGRGPEVIRAIASTIARLAAAARTLRTPPPDPVRGVLARLRDDPEAFIGGRVACSKHAPRPISSSAEALAIPPESFVDAPCPPFGTEVAAVPVATRWALGSSQRACAALRALERQAALVDTIRDGLHDLLASTPSPSDANGLAFERRFDALSASYRDEYPKLDSLATSLGSAIAAALADRALTGQSTEVQRAPLGLDSLCSVDELHAAGGRERCPETWRLLDTLGIAIAGRPAVELRDAGPGPADVAARLAEASRGSHTFFFRQPIPERFQLLRCSETEDGEGGSARCAAFETDAPVVEWVLHPRSGLGSLTMKQSAFRTAQLSIAFSELGVPATLRSISSSPAGTLVGALAEGTRTLREEYQDTLERLVDIEAQQRELGLADLTTQIERLEKEQELRDQLLPSDASGAGSLAGALAQAQAESELAGLRTRLDLGLTRETLALKATTAALAARLATLEQQVTLLGDRVELAGRHD